MHRSRAKTGAQNQKKSTTRKGHRVGYNSMGKMKPDLRL